MHETVTITITFFSHEIKNKNSTLPFIEISELIMSSMILTLSCDMGLKAKIPDILDNVSLSFPGFSQMRNFTTNFCKSTIGQRSKHRANYK